MSKWNIVKIHSKKAGDHRRNRKDDGHSCQKLHYNIQVIGDYRSKGVHRTAQYPAVNIGHLDGLLVLYNDILQKVFILRIFPHPLCPEQLFQHYLVGAQGGCEINQALFQLQQLNELTVLL